MKVENEVQREIASVQMQIALLKYDIKEGIVNAMPYPLLAQLQAKILRLEYNLGILQKSTKHKLAKVSGLLF